MRNLQEIINVCKSRRSCSECPVADYCQEVKLMFGTMNPDSLMYTRFNYLTDENRKSILRLEVHRR